MKLEDLTPEEQEKIRLCETPEEILAAARKMGRKLSDEELEAVAGGADGWKKMIQCPACDSWDTEERTSVLGNYFYVCLTCGYRWTD